LRPLDLEEGRIRVPGRVTAAAKKITKSHQNRREGETQTATGRDSRQSSTGGPQKHQPDVEEGRQKEEQRKATTLAAPTCDGVFGAKASSRKMKATTMKRDTVELSGPRNI
jgi:hypothetical protein